MSCKHCFITELTIEIKCTTNPIEDMLSIIHNHLKRRNIPIEIKDKHLFTNEEGATSIYDFSQDHMDMNEIYYRILDHQWQPLTNISKVLEAKWIDQIIQKKQIHCHYQPILTADKQIYGYELLARFNDSTGQTIYPDVIFDAARKRGRLYALDRLCRLTAVRHAANIPDNKKAFINFIPTSIYSPAFCLRSTTRLAEQLHLDTDRLVFEVVETDKVDDVNHLKDILHYYRNRGFNYALDDVGEGFSTINLLTDLKPNVMKLDMKYVQGVTKDRKKQQAAILFLEKANEIGSIPLAEGIETEEDFMWLKQRGYQLFQGYLFGKPTPEIKTSI
ncbi:putative membrane protein YjcC [Paraliobacillus sp. PM-2]|uniref:EAL domain-containing protein n=1 Tax=Paraliobacillus sp. PM-2 TaxID=1462524 RepID=UPI00061BB9B0|nr:EAL domain-containing protein [Paraliobacillus sp. PM-2]CQR46370.1 putative membrane protein YjcC [Paraliobacillus sp. PM-2]